MNAISSEDEVTLISVLTGIIMNTFVLSDRHFLLFIYFLLVGG